MKTPREALTELGLVPMEAGQHHHVSHGWLGLDCPRCSPNSGRYRLGYNLAGGYLSCWVCGSLPLADTLAELSRRPAGEVRLLMREVPKVRDRAEATVVRGRLIMPDGWGPLLPPHERYLKGRGFDPHSLRQAWRLKGIGRLGRGRLAWRVLIPIHDAAGGIASWTARAITDDVKDRYHNAKPEEEALPAKSLLYGAMHARHAVAVHEGPADVWRTGPGAVALMGLAYGREQLIKLSRYPVRVVCFDSEPAAQRRAVRLCDDLAAFPGVTHRVELDAEDPGSASEREVKLLREMIHG